MDGHAMWDDPPDGYSERDLLIWSRGYLHAESVHLGNAAEVIRAAHDLPFGLAHVMRELSPPPASGSGGEATTTKG